MGHLHKFISSSSQSAPNTIIVFKFSLATYMGEDIILDYCMGTNKLSINTSMH